MAAAPAVPGPRLMAVGGNATDMVYGPSPRAVEQLLDSLKRPKDPGCFSGCFSGSSFLLAVSEGRTEDVDAVLAQNVTMLRERVGTSRRNAWHIAAAKGNVEVLKLLAQHVRDSRQSLARMSSSMTRSGGSIRRRLMSPSDMHLDALQNFMNSATSRGYTPLICAALGDHGPTVELLLSMGADPWLGDELGMNALHHAARAGAISAVHALLQTVSSPPTTLAPPLNASCTKYVDCMDTFGCAPLHHAVWAGHRGAIAALLGYDANVIQRTARVSPQWAVLPAGVTALHLAAFKGSLELVKQLLRAYYETSADLMPSQTALLGTIERRRRQRSHPDPRLILTRTHRLPFHIAARMKHRPLLDWLDPSIPLMFLFGGDDGSSDGAAGGDGACVGVSRLTVLAAKALHAALQQSLSDAKEALTTGVVPPGLAAAMAGAARTGAAASKGVGATQEAAAAAAASNANQGSAAGGERSGPGGGPMGGGAAGGGGGGAEALEAAVEASGGLGNSLRRLFGRGTAAPAGGVHGHGASRFGDHAGEGAGGGAQGAGASAAGGDRADAEDGAAADGGGASGSGRGQGQGQQQGQGQGQRRANNRKVANRKGRKRKGGSGGGAGAGPFASEAEGDGGDGASSSSNSNSVMRRLYRLALERGSGSSNARNNMNAASAAVSVNLLNRTVILPDGPDDHVAYFRYNDGAEPHYPMPTAILTSPHGEELFNSQRLMEELQVLNAQAQALQASQHDQQQQQPSGSGASNSGSVVGAAALISAAGGASNRTSAEGTASVTHPHDISHGAAEGSGGGFLLTAMLGRNSTDSGGGVSEDPFQATAGAAAIAGALEGEHLQPPQAPYPAHMGLAARLPPLGPVPEEFGASGAVSLTPGGSGATPPGTAPSGTPGGGGCEPSPGAPPAPAPTPQGDAHHHHVSDDLHNADVDRDGGGGISDVLSGAKRHGSVGGMLPAGLPMEDGGVYILDGPSTSAGVGVGGQGQGSPPPSAMRLPGAAEPTTPPEAATRRGLFNSGDQGGGGTSVDGVSGDGSGARGGPPSPVPASPTMLPDAPAPTPLPQRPTQLQNQQQAQVQVQIGQGHRGGVDRENWLNASGRFASDMFASLRSKLRGLGGASGNQVTPMQEEGEEQGPGGSGGNGAGASGSGGEVGQAGEGGDDLGRGGASSHSASGGAGESSSLADPGPAAGSGPSGSRLLRMTSAGGTTRTASKPGKAKGRVGPLFPPMFSRNRSRANKRGSKGGARGGADGPPSPSRDVSGQRPDQASSQQASEQGGGALSPGAAAAAASSAAAAAPAAASYGGAMHEEDGDDTCPVCLEDNPNLRVLKCRHALCTDCAADLLKRNVLTPALCPYCRGVIAGFAPVMT